jgi:predicted anti-sigma-YlaC factor YlaD
VRAVPTHCERARQWVSAELDGRLSEFEQALLNGHIRSCAECRAFRGSAVGFTHQLRAAPLERLAQPVSVSYSRRRIAFRIAPAVAALAVAAVGLGSILASSIVRPGPEVSQAPRAPDTAQLLTPAQGPVNLSSLSGIRRDRIVEAATTVDTSRVQRPSTGGPVLR